MALSLIMFDCDGVILESLNAKTQAFVRIASEFGEAGAELVRYHMSHGGTSRLKKFEWFYKEVLGRDITPEESAGLNDKFVEYALAEVRRSPLVPGVQEVLDAWTGRVPMYVASGAPHEELLFILQERKLDHYFQGIYGSPPAKTEILRIILRETNIPPADALMIGDADTDRYAAEAVRTRFYGRGEYFKHSGHPWHHDLTRLNAYLEELHSEL